MEAFETFIESEAFFPVLILILVVLLVIFFLILFSDKINMRKRRTIKNQNNYINVDSEQEIRIVKEEKDNKVDEKELEQDDFERQNNSLKEELIKSDVLSDNEVTDKNIDILAEIELEKDDITENILNEKELEEEFNSTAIETVSFEEIRDLIEDTEDNHKEEKEVLNSNEEVILEEAPVSPEINDFPDFSDLPGANGKPLEEISQDDLENSTVIEEEVINAANEYIASVMQKKDNEEK